MGSPARCVPPAHRAPLLSSQVLQDSQQQLYFWPNVVLFSEVVINCSISGNKWDEFAIWVDVDTPPAIFDRLLAALQEFTAKVRAARGVSEGGFGAQMRSCQGNGAGGGGEGRVVPRPGRSRPSPPLPAPPGPLQLRGRRVGAQAAVPGERPQNAASRVL